MDISKRKGNVDEAWRAPRSATLELITKLSQVSITSPAFNVSMNRKLVKIDYIYVWKIITRIIHFYNQKKKKKSLHRKGKEAWRARFPPRSAPPRINNTSLLLDYFSSIQCINEPKTCQNRLYMRLENYHENYSFL